MIQITSLFALPDASFEERFIRASGAGGQNVNKVSSAVQLRFDSRSSGLDDDVLKRLERLAGHRLTRDGVIVLTSQVYRTQERNRAGARARMIALIAAALVPPPSPRKATKMPRAIKARILAQKTERSATKRLRARVEVHVE